MNCPATAQAELLGQGNLVNLLLWSAGLIVVLLAAGAVMLWLRRKYYEHGSGGAADARLSLDSLERMYRDGQISRDEFRTLRNAVLGLKAEPQPAADASAAQGAGLTSGPGDLPGGQEKNAGGDLSPPVPDDDGKQ